MTYRNNFTCAPEGEASIEVSAFYDTNLSRIAFEENFERIDDSDSFFFTDYGSLKNEFKPRLEGTKPALRMATLAIVREESSNPSLYAGEIFENRHNLTEWLLNFIQKEVYDHLTIETRRDWAERLAEYGIRLEDSFLHVKIHGYSQRDVAQVIWDSEELTALWGKEPDESELEKMFTHYFFDSPIFAVVTVDGEEYFYEGDSYEWERDAFAESLEKQTGINKTEFLALLPKELDYV